MDIHQEDAVMNKGKRTKRQRTTSTPSAFVLTMGGASSSSSAAAAAAGVFLDVSGGYSDHRFTASSTSDSGDLAQSSVEEEDMANCLILLARGSGGSQKAAAAAEVYQCKTCERCFPSFQALGGHRASHKKPPKAVVYSEEQKHVKSSIIRVVNYSDNSSTALSLQIPGRESGKSRVHECSICGAEFSSGQALGGHMRRHRPLPTATTAAASSSSTNEDAASLEAVKKQRTLLSLDLNLDPAPEPEEHDAFTSKQDTIVFTASPLVDCHY